MMATPPIDEVVGWAHDHDVHAVPRKGVTSPAPTLFELVHQCPGVPVRVLPRMSRRWNRINNSVDGGSSSRLKVRARDSEIAWEATPVVNATIAASRSARPMT